MRARDESAKLPSRAPFFNELQEEIGQFKQAGRPLGLLIISLRRIREINITFGYRVGDRLLEAFAGRVRGILRHADSFRHIGGNDFALLLSSVFNAGHAILAANRIQSLLEQPLVIDGHTVRAQAVIGIALYPNHAGSAESLMRRAEMALSHALAVNKPYEIFQDELPATSLVIESELQRAIESDELVLYYQPKIDMKTRRCSSSEALVRWISPERGFVGPDLFIPVAEATDLITPLTLWTLNTALRNLAEFRGKWGEMSVAVNLSPNCLHEPNMVDLIQQAINVWDAEPGHLVLEVTESAMMHDPRHALAQLQRLHDMGIMLSIDDFGTGYSSLAYMKSLPIDELKIDQAFVRHMMDEEGDAMIVRSTIDLAHNFRHKVVAEGIEDELTFETLANLGCDVGQGYFMGKPMAAEQLEVWMRESPWGIKA